jgi:hypothetical protein
MSIPDPYSSGHGTMRKRLDTYERSLTGGVRQYGHLAVYTDEVEGWLFRRCRCNFSLALSPNGHIYWLRCAWPAVEITSYEQLLGALAADCPRHLRPKPKADSRSQAAPVPPSALKAPSLAEPPAAAESIRPPAPTTVAASRPETQLVASIKQERNAPPPVKRLQTFIPSTPSGAASGQRKTFAQ